MQHARLFDKLKSDYGFRENHILIIEALLKEDLTAEEICLNTKIPKGRIYEFLNFLTSVRIVEAKGKHPKLYSVQPLPEKIRKFLEVHFQETVDKESEIKSLIHHKIKEIIPIKAESDFIPLLRKMLVGSESIKILTSVVPHVFYTHNKESFQKFSDYFVDTEFSISIDPVINIMIREAFWKAYEQCRDFEYVVDTDVLNSYKTALSKLFTQKEAKEVLVGIRKYLEKSNLKVYHSEIKNPYYLVISQRAVLILIIAQNSLAGAYIRSKDISKVYQALFDEARTKATNILDIWDEEFQ